MRNRRKYRIHRKPLVFRLAAVYWDNHVFLSLVSFDSSNTSGSMYLQVI